MSDNSFVLQPIGVVHADVDDPMDMPIGGRLAEIEVFPSISLL